MSMNGLIKALSCTPNRENDTGEWNGRDYRLLDAMEYESKDGIRYVVPAGFVTDFATWIRSSGKWAEASVLHDYLYSKDGSVQYGTTRKQADKLFKEVMTRSKCPRWRINMFYYGVRLFGWYFYDGN